MLLLYLIEDNKRYLWGQSGRNSQFYHQTHCKRKELHSTSSANTFEYGNISLLANWSKNEIWKANDASKSWTIWIKINERYWSWGFLAKIKSKCLIIDGWQEINLRIKFCRCFLCNWFLTMETQRIVWSILLKQQKMRIILEKAWSGQPKINVFTHFEEMSGLCCSIYSRWQKTEMFGLFGLDSSALLWEIE